MADSTCLSMSVADLAAELSRKLLGIIENRRPLKDQVRELLLPQHETAAGWPEGCGEEVRAATLAAALRCFIEKAAQQIEQNKFDPHLVCADSISSDFDRLYEAMRFLFDAEDERKKKFDALAERLKKERERVSKMALTRPSPEAERLKLERKAVASPLIPRKLREQGIDFLLSQAISRFVKKSQHRQEEVIAIIKTIAHNLRGEAKAVFSKAIQMASEDPS